MNKRLEIIQEEDSDCGICCLASIIKYYGGYIPLETLRINTYTSVSGTSAYNIINCAKKIGFDAYGERINNINNIKLPAIAHLKLENDFYHFVVLYKIYNKYLIVMDPSIGFKKIRKEDFLKKFTNVVINFNIVSSLPIYQKNNFLKNEFIKYVRDNKKNIIIVLLLNIAIMFFMILLNLEIKIIEYNNKYIYFIFMLILLNESFQYIKNKIQIINSTNYNNVIINYFTNHIFKLPSNYLKLKQKGEISTRFNELDEYSKNIFNFIIDIFFNIFLIIFLLVIIFVINKTLFIYTFIITVVYLYINNKIYNKLYNNFNYYINMEENYKSNILDYITKIFTIKNLHHNNFFLNNIKENLLCRNNYYKSLNKKLSLVNSFNNIFLNTITLMILYFLIIKDYNLSNSLLILYLINNYINLIRLISNSYPTYIYYKNIVKKNNEFLSYMKKDKDKLDLTNINIKFYNINYKIGNKNIINNFNYVIKDNTKLFINGPSGIGKSTLLKILNNEIDNYDGKILFNKYNIKDYDNSNLITYVSQDEELFNDTIKNNLLLNETINEDSFNKIIKICRLENLIECKKTNDVIINSNNISGGEKNRLILARSLIHSKKIIILDEVLKEVDHKLEVSIVKDLLYYFKDRTIIYVSHKKLDYLFDDVLTFREE